MNFFLFELTNKIEPHVMLSEIQFLYPTVLVLNINVDIKIIRSIDASLSF